MSRPVSVPGLGKRPKRASRACDHCRWKRLKCSDEKKDQSCMNCVIYGTPCEYNSPWSPISGKSKELSSKTASARGKKPRKDRDSLSPGLLESQSSRASSLADDGLHSPPTGAIPMTDARQAPADFTGKSPPGLAKDLLDEQLDQYTAFLTSFGANRNSPLEVLTEEMGLPSQQITNALLQAYTQGFQAGSSATQAKMRGEIASSSRQARPARGIAPTSPLDYGEVNINSLAMDHLSPSSPDMSNGNVQSPIGYSMQLQTNMGLDSHDYPLPLHTVPNVNGMGNGTSRRIAQPMNHGMAAPRSIPTSVDWEVYADQWNGTSRQSVPVNGMPQDRYDSKFSFIMEDGFGRRRRGE